MSNVLWYELTSAWSQPSGGAALRDRPDTVEPMTAKNAPLALPAGDHP